ncbi:cytochrome P450 [Penicillium angulare]|uniref:cytochrome P450 n=1 Tax=Penicillium angulare TaxID=116970 RepID=UPI002541277E|nr:cytochrome P450 [Penicillium angulare]KAJ5291528.1 cytochrome P450 [Penicillium angulare]
MLSSIIIYRLFFHRLRHFPGPRLGAASKLWSVYKCRDSRNHLFLDELNKKYGTFVRTGQLCIHEQDSSTGQAAQRIPGPAEITIFHPKAWEALDGAGNANIRSDWYDIVHPRISPIFSRIEEDHTERRKVWNRALSMKSIREYLPRILQQIGTLESIVAGMEGQPISPNDIMQWFAFDSMGEFAFNESFDMMKTKNWHRAIIQQRSALAILGSLNHTVWAIRLAFAFLGRFWRVKDWMGMISFCDQCIERRLQNAPAQPDIASYFIEEFHNGRNEKNWIGKKQLLSGNTVSVIVGGSDTTGPSLILVWYFMASYPEYAERVYQEVKNIDPSDITGLSKLPCLNGFINETMRLIPAALTMGTRMTPAQGMTIDGTYIPGGIKLAAPKYTIFRSERSFEDPLSFVPERWYSRPEMIRDKDSFAPFGVGRRACVGKNLALTQIRLVVTILLSRYIVRFAPGETGEAVERDMRDQLTAQPGRYEVVFEPRG